MEYNKNALNSAKATFVKRHHVPHKNSPFFYIKITFSNLFVVQSVTVQVCKLQASSTTVINTRNLHSHNTYQNTSKFSLKRRINCDFVNHTSPLCSISCFLRYELHFVIGKIYCHASLQTANITLKKSALQLTEVHGIYSDLAHLQCLCYVN